MREQVDYFMDMLKSGDNAGILHMLKSEAGLAKAKTKEGVSLISMAAYFRNEEIKNALLALRDSLDIYEAVACGKLEEVKQHIETNLELLDANSVDGFSALSLASYLGQEHIVAYLLTKGANVDQVSNNSMRIAPIHSAVAINSVPIAKLLLEHGADVNAKQQQGVTALHSAVHRNNQEMVQLLLTHGADLHPKMEDGKTPLAIAEEEGHTDLADFLRNYQNA